MTSPYEEAYLKAFDEHVDALFRHASFRMSSRDRAADLTQETFLKAWEYLQGGGEIRHWKSFLYRILNNLIIDEYRRKKEQSLDSLLEEHPGSLQAKVAVGSRSEKEDALDQEFALARVKDLIQELPELQRNAVTLRYVDGLSPKEVALVLGVSENVAAVRIHRAVEHLKKLYGPTDIV